MTWTDTLDDREQKELELARVYAKDFHHGTTGHMQLMLLAKVARLLDQREGELQLARLHALDDRPPLEQLVAAARQAGAEGTWIVRGAVRAALIYTNNPAADPDDPAADIADWPALALTPPHQVIVLIRIPESDGGEPGIEFHGAMKE